MNVNGARFHLFLGQSDWADCLAGDGTRLGPLWKPEPDLRFPWWDEEEGELGLAPSGEAIPLTPGERAFRPDDRRDAAADRHGNLYHVADDRLGLMVRSAGSGRVARFWPPPEAPLGRERGGFGDLAPPAAPVEEVTAVAVLEGDYLVAALSGGDRPALLRFDLIGGGGPERFALADGIGPAALAAIPGGGAWLLDTDGKRLLRLDRQLRFAATAVADEMPTFAPESEAPPAATRPELVSIDLSAAPAATALAAFADGTLLILDSPGGGAPARLLVVEPGGTSAVALPPLGFDAFCIAPDEAAGALTASLGDSGGNRARRVQLVRDGGGWTAAASPDTLPLRRFGGRALVPILGQVHYDSGEADPLWIPVVRRPHRAFAGQSLLLTPVRDGGEPQCEWDRVRLDACVPAGASVRIEARASDYEDQLTASPATGWTLQPDLVFSPEGSELPGKRAIAAAPPDPARRRGTWELLLQGIVGRYAQLRITLAGDGRTTPRLRALRLWYPRFSYVERFLPAVYREDAVSASFLTRFLANFEGINTAIEDRIAAAEALFDPRTAPAGMLDWLASWFEVALDAGWDERRQRLFLAHAARFFGWRGTVKGLKLALKLAVDPKISASDFALDGPDRTDPRGVRIAEAFRRLPSPRRFHPRAAGGGGPGARSLDAPWSPEEGSEGLWARWEAEAGRKRPAGAGRFPLYPPQEAAEWEKVAADAFGFVPSAGFAERSRWQAFQHSLGLPSPAELPVRRSPGETWAAYAALPTRERLAWQAHLRGRYRTIGRLNAAHGGEWADFAEIPLPARLPEAEQAVRDWLIFEGHRLPKEASAHRFTVLLPRRRVDSLLDDEQAQLARARRVIAIEKPAHTRFDVRFYWAMNRVGEARIGLDSEIGQGSRAPELVPGAILGRAFVGAAFVGGPAPPSGGRERLAC
ncbi:MAG TPA: phage tail protein [Allosphingosinicella sp.]|nr:phage tail protein [Allosphingosinicella sp.]